MLSICGGLQFQVRTVHSVTGTRCKRSRLHAPVPCRAIPVDWSSLASFPGLGTRLGPVQQARGTTLRFSTWIRSYVNPLRPNIAYLQRETFSFMMSHPAMSLRDRLCASRKGGAGGGGWVHPKGANSMAEFGLSFERPLVGAG